MTEEESVPRVASLWKGGEPPSTEDLCRLGMFYIKHSQERQKAVAAWAVVHRFVAKAKAEKRRAEEDDELVRKVKKLVAYASKPLSSNNEEM